MFDIRQNDNGEVVVSGRLGLVRSLFAFHPELGNYEYRTDPVVSVLPGQQWEFHCPLCSSDLTTPFRNTLAHVHMVDGAGELHTIVFSKLAGEHATFDVTKDAVESYGDQDNNYIEYSIGEHYW